MEPPDRIRHSPPREDVAATDRRWLIVTATIFLATVLLLSGLYQLYVATGPHPEMTLLFRSLTRLAHWLLPGR